VLDPLEKTIVHIPNVNSRESTKDKIKEVEHIIEAMLGEWQGTDPATGFQIVQDRFDGRRVRIADLVDDDAAQARAVSAALKDAAAQANRDHVDIIIALGMAKEGFDWIWCEHALTIGYRASLTEIVQIIGRATRDAPGKTPGTLYESDRRARRERTAGNGGGERHAEGDRGQPADGAGARAALRVQAEVLRRRPDRRVSTTAPAGYDPSKCNVGLNGSTGQFEVEIKGLAA
jgi:hypothetical protein